MIHTLNVKLDILFRVILTTFCLIKCLYIVIHAIQIYVFIFISSQLKQKV